MCNQYSIVHTSAIGIQALQGLLKDSITFMSSSVSSKSKTCIPKYMKMSEIQTYELREL